MATGKSDHTVDVLVVGAGPAGSAAALATAGRGLRTVIAERRLVVGRPVRCGEYVPMGLGREAPGGQSSLSIVQKVPAMTLHLPDADRLQSIEAPGAIVDRGELDRACARAAEAAGAELWLGSPVVELRRNGQAALGGTRAGQTVRARLVIGCDGPRSRVAPVAGLGRPRVMLGLQREVKLHRPVTNAHLHFWSTCRYGYGWLFPKGELANLGVAVPRGAAGAGRQALRELTAQLRRAGTLPEGDGETDGRGDPGRGGLVPCSGPLPRLAAGRILVAGDAAGQTDPLSGAGIVSALRGGSLAGKAAADALRAGNWKEAATMYDGAWRAAYARSAARSLQRRYELEALWDRDLERAVAGAWLGKAK